MKLQLLCVFTDNSSFLWTLQTPIFHLILYWLSLNIWAAGKPVPKILNKYSFLLLQQCSIFFSRNLGSTALFLCIFFFPFKIDPLVTEIWCLTIFYILHSKQTIFNRVIMIQGWQITSLRGSGMSSILPTRYFINQHHLHFSQLIFYQATVIQDLSVSQNEKRTPEVPGHHEAEENE